LLLGTVSCGSGVPQSSLTIREAVSDLLLATSQTQGVLRLAPGETRQIRILRTFKSDTGLTRTDDVTQFTNFKFEYNDAGITYDQLGNIRGTDEGLAVLECKFREDPFEPYDVVKLTVEVQTPVV